MWTNFPTGMCAAGRERYWGSEMTQDKIDAYMTLYTVLETFIRLIAPFTPFICETIYQNLVRSVDQNAPESVHLCGYPMADVSRIDEQLEENMERVLKIVTLGRACRNTAGLKNRQPLSTMYVGGVEQLPEQYLEIIKGELNIKAVKLGAEMEQFITYQIKPQLRTLGPKYGKLLGGIRAHLSQADGSAIVKAVAGGGVYRFEVNGQPVSLAEEDLLIEPMQKEGFAVETEGEYAVILDETLTPELIAEGNVREIISKVQTMRKEAGFQVTDHIRLGVLDGEVAQVLREYQDEIAAETLADEVVYGKLSGYEKQWDINGTPATLSVETI